MSGIYIKGIPMPTKGNPIGVLIYPDGSVEWPARDVVGEAIPVPDHGRLGDLDALSEKCDAPYWCVWLGDIDDAPTIIPADEEKSDGD